MKFEQYTQPEDFEAEGILPATITSMQDSRTKAISDNRKTMSILLQFPTPKDSMLPSGIKLEAEPIYSNNDCSKGGEKDTTSLELMYFPVGQQQYAAWYVAHTDVHSKDTRGPNFGQKPSSAAKAKVARERRMQQEARRKQHEQNNLNAQLQDAYNRGAAAAAQHQSPGGGNPIPDGHSSLSDGGMET